MWKKLLNEEVGRGGITVYSYKIRIEYGSLEIPVLSP